MNISELSGIPESSFCLHVFTKGVEETPSCSSQVIKNVTSLCTEWRRHSGHRMGALIISVEVSDAVWRFCPFPLTILGPVPLWNQEFFCDCWHSMAFVEPRTSPTQTCLAWTRLIWGRLRWHDQRVDIPAVIQTDRKGRHHLWEVCQLLIWGVRIPKLHTGRINPGWSHKE